jgi:hypothetical protein
MPATFEFGGTRCDRIVAAVLARLGGALETACQGAARSEAVAAGRPAGSAKAWLNGVE